MSRRPAPLEQRAGRGNPGHRPLPKNAPTRVPGEPMQPPEISEGAKVMWPYYCTILAQRGQLARDSGPSLLLLCETAAEVRALREDVDKKGRFRTVKTKSGDRMERIRPAYRSLMDASRRLVALLIEFGLTDASRGKVDSGPAPPADDKPADDAEAYGLN